MFGFNINKTKLSPNTSLLSGGGGGGCQRGAAAWRLMDGAAQRSGRGRGTKTGDDGGDCCCLGRTEIVGGSPALITLKGFRT